MTASVRETLGGLSNPLHESIVGIGVDTTGSMPAPIDEGGDALALWSEFTEWKDHAAIAEAEVEVFTAHCHCGKPADYSKYIGGIYSSEPLHAMKSCSRDISTGLSSPSHFTPSRRHGHV
jgi:L-ribulokinase